MYRTIVARRIRRAWRHVDQHDYAYVLDQLAATFTHRFAGDHALAGTRHHPEAARAWYQRLYRLLPGIRFQVTDVLVGGWPWRTRAVALVRVHATVAGAPYENEVAQVVDLRWGRITGLAMHEDTQKLADALARLHAAGVPEAAAPPIRDPAAPTSSTQPVARHPPMTPEHATPTAEDTNRFLQVTGLRLGKVDGKRVRDAIEPDERQPTPWGLAHDGAATTAIETATDSGADHRGRPVVLFDFDGVLIRGDSYAHLVRGVLQRSRRRRLVMLPVLAVAMPMLKAAVLRRWSQRLVVRLAFVGWSTARFHARAAQVGRRLARDQQVVVGDAVTAARRHLASGARVVVVTTSAQPLARAVLDELRLSSVELVASQPTCGRLGLRAPMRNHGVEKVRRLAAHGLHPLWEIAYSDSPSDLPMLHGAVRPVLVNPGVRLLARARRELGQRILWVEWR